MQHDDERMVQIDANTALETMTTQRDVDRMRREAGLPVEGDEDEDADASSDSGSGGTDAEPPGNPTAQPGVPPETNDDVDDPVDHDSADSFPASDPPANY